MPPSEILFPFRQGYTQFTTMPKMRRGICFFYSIWFLLYGFKHHFNSKAAIGQLKEECISDEATPCLRLLAGLPEAGPLTKLLADSSVTRDYSGLRALALTGDEDSKALYSMVNPLNECPAARILLQCDHSWPCNTVGHKLLQLWSQLDPYSYLAIQTWELSDELHIETPKWSYLPTKMEFKLCLLYHKLLTRNMLFKIMSVSRLRGTRHAIAAFYDPNLNGFVLFDPNLGVITTFPDIGAEVWCPNRTASAQDTPFSRFCRYFQNSGYDPISITAVIDYRKILSNADMQIGNGGPLHSGCRLPENLTVPVETMCDRVLFERFFKATPEAEYKYEGYILYNKQRPDAKLKEPLYF